MEPLRSAASHMRSYLARKTSSTAWWVLIFFLTNFAICTALLVYVAIWGTADQLKVLGDVHVKNFLGLLGAFGTYAIGGLVNKKLENGNKATHDKPIAATTVNKTFGTNDTLKVTDEWLWPSSGYFKKKGVVIKAMRLVAPTKVNTLEGEMSGAAGDWLITGVEGEQYICKDSIFRQTYTYFGQTPTG